MRDRKAYEAHGRNDPTAPEQLREHPYDFVSLPPRPARGDAVGHHRYAPGRLTGTLRLVYVTVTPLHVGSGVFETARECGLGERSTPVRGIARRQGRPVLPGSGWKGTVRTRYEAITRSRLCLVDAGSREPAFKVPEALRSVRGSHKVVVEDPRVTRELSAMGTIRTADDLGKLSPADALFGCMGYRARVHPSDGEIEVASPASAPLDVAPLESPVMHRLAQPGAMTSDGRGTLRIARIEGRKFYYDGPIVHSRQDDRATGGRYELIDHVPPGATITVAVRFESLTRAELGALLVGAGYGAHAGVVRFGGFKPVGLGKVELREARATAGDGREVRRWRREHAAVDLDAAVAEAKEKLIDVDALAELAAVTTRRRPEA